MEGYTGPTGPTGPIGPTGPRGSTGITGPTGNYSSFLANSLISTGTLGFVASPGGTPISSSGFTYLDTTTSNASFYLPTPGSNYFKTTSLTTPRTGTAYINTDQGSYVLTPTDHTKELAYISSLNSWKILNNETYSFYPTVQQGVKLVGTGAVGSSLQGAASSISADGNTFAMGGNGDNGNIGATWIFTRLGGIWSQQGGKLVGTGAAGTSNQYATSLSADGNTLAIGGPGDALATGAIWIFIRSGGIWTQQGSKLVGIGAIGPARQGFSVALSADGNTLAFGGNSDNGSIGAIWIFTRSGIIWSQESKLVGTGGVGNSEQGRGISISADGNTVASGAFADNGNVGATWIFTRFNGVWTQQGNKLVGTGNVGGSNQSSGNGVALSADGNTLAVGGAGDNGNIGATWIFTRSNGVWIQQGNKLVGTGGIGSTRQGDAVALSADGNTLIIGGPGDNSNRGASWVFIRSSGIWTQIGNKIIGIGSIGSSNYGYSVALSADGSTQIVTGVDDNGSIGAAWVFV